MKNLFLFALTIVLLGSCSTQFQVAKKHHSDGYYVSITNNHSKISAKEVNNQANFEKIHIKTKEVNNLQIADAPLRKFETADVTINENSKPANILSKSNNNQSSKSDAQEIKRNIKSNKKEIKNAIKNTKQSKSSDADSFFILLIILALIIPPLAVYLHSKDMMKLLISILLTLFFWVPGVIYALLVVFDII